MSSRKRNVPVPTTSVTLPPLDTVNMTGFDVIFAGLICFSKTPRVALFANGVVPVDPQVVPHHPYVIVDPARVTKEVGWQGYQPFKLSGIYNLPTCEVQIPGATTAGTLDATQHDRDTPLLFNVDNAIQIDPATADAVVRVSLGNGTLQALRHPNSNPKDPDNVPIISRLRIENNSNPIVVNIRENGTITRSLELQANTDIALVNIGFPPDKTKPNQHFSIFGTLTKGKKIKGFPTSSPRVTKIHRHYYIFTLILPISDGLAMCGTSGCCPPPP